MRRAALLLALVLSQPAAGEVGDRQSCLSEGQTGLSVLHSAEAHDVVRAFYAAWEANDVAAAMRLWSADAQDDSLRRTTRAVAVRCVRIDDLHIETASCEERGACELTATMQMTRWSGMPGAQPSRERTSEVLRVRNEAGRWKIVSRRAAEEALVDAFDALGSVAERDAFLDAHRDAWTPELVRRLGARAILLVNRDNSARAGEVARAAQRVAEAIADPAMLALAISAEGTSLRARRPPEHAASVSRTTRALEIAERAGDVDVLAAVLLRHGRASGQGPPMFERVLTLEPWVEDLTPLAMASTNLASHYETARQYQEALVQSQETARLAQLTGNAVSIISAEMNLGGLYLTAGDPELAVASFEHAAALAHAHGFTGVEASLIHALASTDMERGRPPAEVIARVNRGLEIARRNSDGYVASDLLSLRAQMRSRLGQMDEAMDDMGESLSYAALSGNLFPETAGDALFEIFERQGRYREAAWVSEVFGRRPQQIDALRNLGDVDAALCAAEFLIGLDDAEFAGSNDALRYRLLSREPRHNLYQTLADLHVERGEVAEALSIADESKARLLMNGVRVADQTDTPDEMTLAKRIEDLNRRLLASSGEKNKAAIRTELKQARLALLDLQARRSIGSPQVMTAIDAPLLWTDRDSVAVEYVTAKSRTLLFVVRAGAGAAPRIHVATANIGRDALTALIDEHSRRVAARDLRYEETARRLYDLLIAPAAKLIGDAESICIIPDGQLWRLPFHTLRAPDGASLIDRAALWYAPSIRFVNAHPAPPASGHRPRLLALGNPTVAGNTSRRVRALYRDIPLATLDEAEDEVETIGRLYGSRSSVYIRDVARESRFKSEASRYDILHLAAHGLLDRNAPLFSAVVLAADDEDDGLLEAREIAAMHLRQPIVVLSACETASGSVRSGEGAIGLSWAFLAAGARVTVGSQWRTPSAAAEQLMTELHRRLLAGDSVPAALRAAQLALKRNPRYRHPFYWAPFIVVGAP